METEVAWDEESTNEIPGAGGRLRDVVGQRHCTLRPLDMTAECLTQCPAHAE